ncbi:hypothetical protein [Streptococcus plurextorum]|uniref:hypothetical protein n=1 Tax=Streptococcus plurextorum TaxID=456876 RepID=UPI000402D2AB|nr:hypothetical protein [Streptococcus plurextorum]
MVKLFSKLLIFGGVPIRTKLPEQGIFAEYDLLTKSLIWKQRDEGDTKQTQVFINVVLIIFVPLAGAPLLLSYISRLFGEYGSEAIIPIERFGLGIAVLLPIIAMFIMSVVFEYLMHYFKKNARRIEPPAVSEQIIYLEDLYTSTIRQNAALAQYKTPYVAMIISMSGLVLLDVAMYWVYWQESTLASFLLKLVILGILLTVTFPINFRYIILRTIIIKKLLKELYKR